MSLFRNGRAELHAEEWRGNTWHGKKGDYSGEVDIFDYGKLCYLLQQNRFDAMPGLYGGNWTDAPTTIVTATKKGATKTVSDYSHIGPIELWSIQQAIDAIAEDIRWSAK